MSILKRMSRPRLRKTAIHEAGHAVIAFLLNVPFDSVSILPDNHSLGRVVLSGHPDCANPQNGSYDKRRALKWLDKRTCISLAGQISERLDQGGKPRAYSLASDNGSVADYALEIHQGCEATASAWINSRYVHTETLLRREAVWRAVSTLAETLISRRKLQRGDVIAVIQASGLRRNALFG